jgi:hypothetical protein
VAEKTRRTSRSKMYAHLFRQIILLKKSNRKRLLVNQNSQNKV